eukprot:1153254-Prorocentrum_minimum.AAC.1
MGGGKLLTTRKLFCARPPRGSHIPRLDPADRRLEQMALGDNNFALYQALQQKLQNLPKKLSFVRVWAERDE